MHATMHGADGDSKVDAVARQLDAMMAASQYEDNVNYDQSESERRGDDGSEASSARACETSGESNDHEVIGEHEYDGGGGDALESSSEASGARDHEVNDEASDINGETPMRSKAKGKRFGNRKAHGIREKNKRRKMDDMEMRRTV